VSMHALQQVSTFTQLQAAFADTSVDEIIITASITFTDAIELDRTVTVRGGGCDEGDSGCTQLLSGADTVRLFYASSTSTSGAVYTFHNLLFQRVSCTVTGSCSERPPTTDGQAHARRRSTPAFSNEELGRAVRRIKAADAGSAVVRFVGLGVLKYGNTILSNKGSRSYSADRRSSFGARGVGMAAKLTRRGVALYWRRGSF